MRRRLIVVLLATIVVGDVGVVESQPQSADVANRDRALSLFRDSDAHYKRGEFERAAQLLREAHALYPEPLLLYNLARALEGSGDFQGAVDHYQRYLDEAIDIPDRGAIERRIATLKAQLAARVTPPEVDEPVTLPVSGIPDSPPDGGADIDPRARDVRVGPRRLPWLIAGGGVAVLGAGVAFGYLSVSRHDAAVDEPVQVEAAELQDQAHTFANLSTGALIAGGLITVCGVTWGVLELRRGRGGDGAPRIAGGRLDLGLGSAQVTWSFR